MVKARDSLPLSRRATALVSEARHIKSCWSTTAGGVRRAETALVTFEFETTAAEDGQRACEAFLAAIAPTIPLSASFGSSTSSIALLGLFDYQLASRPILRLSCGTESSEDLQQVLCRGLAASARTYGSDKGVLDINT